MKNYSEIREDGKKAFHAPDRRAWRAWLEQYHAVEPGVWLIFFHKKSEMPSVSYDEALEEALCYGWIDSKPNKRDTESFYQYFSPRNLRSNWSRRNKEFIERLIRENRMAEAGLRMVEEAKKRGTWDALNEVEDLIMPQDLRTAFEPHPRALAHFDAFPPSVKRSILEWIFTAKRATTRAGRIAETVEKAKKNLRANLYRAQNDKD